jgi:hypothetical protein
MLTEAILKLLHLPWKRGKHVPQTTLPDALLTLDADDRQIVMNWEMFTGSQSNRQLKDRVRAYGKTEEFVVWIAPNPEELERLKKYCARLRNPLFMLMGSDELVDLAGNKTPLDLLGRETIEVNQ